MFCPNCGAQLPDDSTFCEKCGARLEKPVKRDGPGMTKYAVIGIAAILLVAVAALFLRPGTGSEKAAATEPLKESTSNPAQQSAAAPVQEPATAVSMGEKEAASDAVESVSGGQTDRVMSPHWVKGTGNPAAPVILYDTLSEAEKIYYDALEEHYTNGTREVRIGKQKGSGMDEFERAKYAFMNDHPYIGEAHHYTSSNLLPVTAGSDEFRIIFEDRRDHAADLEAIRAETDPFIKNLSGKASEKVLEINNYITDRVVYDYAYYEDYTNQIDESGFRAVDPENMPVELAHSAYAAIVERVAVCDGYALAFAYICQEAGIPCYVLMGDAVTAEGETRTHAWNIVQLEDGNWYEIDTTWNDNSRGDHKYFCIPSSEMEKNHTRKQGDMYGFADVIPRTDEESDTQGKLTGNGSERPAFADFYWADLLIEKKQSPFTGGRQLTDASEISGDWKVMMMNIPSDDDIFKYRMLLNMQISINGDTAEVTADWYRNYTLVPETMQPFSVYDASNDSDVVYAGLFSSSPDEKTLTVQDLVNDAASRYLFNGGGNIETIRIDKFYENNGVQYGVGSVLGNDGEYIARITLVR